MTFGGLRRRVKLELPSQRLDCLAGKRLILSADQGGHESSSVLGGTQQVSGLQQAAKLGCGDQCDVFKAATANHDRFPSRSDLVTWAASFSRAWV